MNSLRLGLVPAIPEVPEPAWLLTARIAGAIAGSAISIAYMLPRGHREAALRLAVGVTAGLVFGGAAGVTIARELGIAEELGTFETVLSGSALASLCAWWGLGVLTRMASRYGAGERNP